MELSHSIKESYSQQYSEKGLSEWRTLGAKYKALNIVELAKDLKLEKVLEVGAGDGSILDWLSKWNFNKSLYAIEISQSGLDSIKKKSIEYLKEVLLFNGYEIPYPDNHFDLVICSHVLEHVEHERILLREIKRVSKYQIFEVPIDFSFYLDKKVNHFLGYGHINIYTPSLFRFLLTTENFKVLKDKCYLYDKEVLKMIFKENKIGLYTQLLKNSLLKSAPYFLGIKPNSYAVLTTKIEGAISIF